MWRAVVSQPLDRSGQTEQLGEIDEEEGEFWVRSPFQIPQLGHNLSAFEPNRLFLNLGGSNFLDASFASNANVDSDSRSVIATDLDGDGGIDLLVGSVGGGPLRIFLNQIPTAHRYVRIELQRAEGESVIGSRVVLHCGDRTITRDLFPANGFAGQGPAELLIGVGKATVIDQVTIRWPNGKTESHNEQPVGGLLRFAEGEQ
jgi:ASPIC and UnbV